MDTRTSANVDEIFVQMNRSGDDSVLFSMKSDSYENISLNMSDLLRLVQEQRAVIQAYEVYYRRVNQ